MAGILTLAVCLLLVFVHRDGVGAPPADPSAPISASNIGALSVGVNLKQASRTTEMTVCDLRWVRF